MFSMDSPLGVVVALVVSATMEIYLRLSAVYWECFIA